MVSKQSHVEHCRFKSVHEVNDFVTLQVLKCLARQSIFEAYDVGDKRKGRQVRSIYLVDGCDDAMTVGPGNQKHLEAAGGDK